jgi:hypothetical protein
MSYRMKRPINALKILVLLTTGIFFLVSFYSCHKIEKVSPIPEINFKSFTITSAYDTLGNPIKLGELVFSFIDGDADIGVDQTAQPGDSNYYNIFLIPYKKVDGVYSQIEVDPYLPPLNYRIPYDSRMDRVGQDKTLKGEISVKIQYQVVPPYDTIKYDFYVRDRAYNKSNVASTTDITFN